MNKKRKLLLNVKHESFLNSYVPTWSPGSLVGGGPTGGP
jgi:hypothetical protein